MPEQNSLHGPSVLQEGRCYANVYTKVNHQVTEPKSKNKIPHRVKVTTRCPNHVHTKQMEAQRNQLRCKTWPVCELNAGIQNRSNLRICIRSHFHNQIPGSNDTQVLNTMRRQKARKACPMPPHWSKSSESSEKDCDSSRTSICSPAFLVVA